MYDITFRVKGDWITEDLDLHKQVEADDLPDLVSKTWQPYREALHHIWRKMEAAVFMEPRPNQVFTIECTCDGKEVDEMEVLNAFFNVRKKEFQDLQNELLRKRRW